MPARAGTALSCDPDGVVAHTHDDWCYDEEGNLICTLPELEEHQHTDDCLDSEGNLVCGLEEVLETHSHGPECLSTEKSGDETIMDATDAVDNSSPPDEGDAGDSDDDDDADSDPADGPVGTKGFHRGGHRRLSQVLTDDDGSQTFSFTVDAPADANIPSSATLEVSEIAWGTDEWVSCAEQATDTLDADLKYAHFFDISIVDDGYEIQPDATVSVSIEATDAEVLTPSAQVLHFAEDGVEVMDAGIDEGVASFETQGFSVYAVVAAPEPVYGDGWCLVNSVEELLARGTAGVYVRNPDGYYFTNKTYSPTSGRTGIAKTKPAASTPDGTAGAAARYHFESADSGGNRFLVYCLDDDDQPAYVRQQGNSLLLVDRQDATSFAVESFQGQSATFAVIGADSWCWNMQGGAKGNGFCAWSDPVDPNSRIRFEYYREFDTDPYGLDGKTFGIAYHDDSVTAAALMAGSSGSQGRLPALDLTMRYGNESDDGVLLVSSDSEIQEWTFHSVDRDSYHLSTVVDGQTKYLTINGSQVSLADAPDPTGSLIRAVPGTGANAGKWHLSVDGYSLSLRGTASDGFNAATGTGQKTWLNLVRKSVFDNDDFVTYGARKVSVSDTTNVYDGQQVIIYTRIWNDDAKHYEFYAVDHDGSLVRCYDKGDEIEWVGTKVNTLLWDFTEHHNADGSPNNYYELQNDAYDNFISPTYANNSTASDEPAYLNLDGRRDGRAYTPVVAWDDLNYDYVSLKADAGHVVACPIGEASDFYFAVVNPVDGDDELTTVETVDNSLYGIEMRMIDYNNEKTGTTTSPRDTGQVTFFGGDNNKAGLLSPQLGADGYPTSTARTGNAGRSLHDLFDETIPVNQLFIRSIHTESGYFEYDSTSNFAHLDVDEDEGAGSFTVYDQIGAIGDYATMTGTHGQFMPYDEMTPGKWCTFTNQTSVTATELPDTDTRKGERLYNLGTRTQVDYHFGMEMSASFTQTPSGLDAWGHDIIFEFSGDDDFWLYVDGELVLDLGGVHSAMTGSINFRTGEVKSSRGNSTLYEIFRNHFRDQGMSAADITLKMDGDGTEENPGLFATNGSGQKVFRDYTTHTMKMFYMERGAGASNLHMRFNLAAVRPGTFVLNKRLSGTEDEANKLLEFPYQIFYRTSDDIADGVTAYRQLGLTAEERRGVTYKDTTNLVRFASTFTPAGGTDAYDNVFFLKPGQSAEVDLPDNAYDYYVVECGVRTDVFDVVKANGDVLDGVQTDNLVDGAARSDFAVQPARLDRRPQLTYDNHVPESAVRDLRLTKRLFDADGETQIFYPDNLTPFSFRLFLGDENADPTALPAANMYEYHVLDPDGFFCRWDSSSQSFVSIGKQDYDSLTADELASATFMTSINGSITKIPIDHTVLVRNVIVSTQYKVLEREDEIPKGYTLRLDDGYTRVDEGRDIRTGDTPFVGTVAAGENPQIEVRNQKGWGLTVDKVWTDRDFMVAHDPIYFAVYVQDATGTGETLVPGTVRRLATEESSIYYFFGNLRSDVPFSRYVVREVVPTGEFSVNETTGVVDGYDSLTALLPGDTLALDGTPVGGEPSTDKPYVYTVTYRKGEQTTQNENVRTDTVTNSRPGILIRKLDWNREPLAGGTFTLTDAAGHDVAGRGYTSDADGVVTIAYVLPGRYTLTETVPPRGHTSLDGPLTIDVGEGNAITVNGVDDEVVDVSQQTATEMATISVRNRTSSLVVRKVAAEDNAPLAGVHFALYRQVTDAVTGRVRRDYNPMPGYEDIVTNADGVLEEINMGDLAGHVYYLSETQSLHGYAGLDEDVCLDIGRDGKVRIVNASILAPLTGGISADWLTRETNDGSVDYTLTIPNDTALELPILGGLGLVAFYGTAITLILVGVVIRLRRAGRASDI